MHDMSFFHLKEVELSHPSVAENPLQEDRNEGEEKQEEERIEEQTVEQEEAGGLMEHKEVEVKGDVDWLRDQEDESSDWPRERVCHTHERAIPIQQTVEALDITEEGGVKAHKCTCAWMDEWMDMSKRTDVHTYIRGTSRTWSI